MQSVAEAGTLAVEVAGETTSRVSTNNNGAVKGVIQAQDRVEVAMDMVAEDMVAVGVRLAGGEVLGAGLELGILGWHMYTRLLQK